MSPLLIIAAAAGLFLVAGTWVVVWLGGRPAEAGLERRLGAVAALLGGEDAVADDGVHASVLRRRRSRSWVSERIDRRFCMLEGRGAFPKAVALGFLVAVAAAVAAVLLRFGTLVPILAPAAWAAGSWSFLAIWDSAKA